MSGFASATQRARARALRGRMTPAETLLWYHLRAHRFLGLSIRRQAPVGPFIVDFLIPAQRLILGVDGDTHADPAGDAARTASLTARGYRILRVTNHDVLANLPGVLQMLAEEMKP